MSGEKPKPSEEKPKTSTNVVDEERFKQERMFKDEWLNRCYKKVALPNPACEKVLGKVNDALAKKLKKTSGSPKHQQALFALLGHNFVKDNFPDRKYDPSVLDKLPAEEKKKLMDETKALLEKETDAAVQDIGMPKNLADYEDNDDLGAYLREVRSTFRNGLDEEVQKEVENFGKKKAEPDSKNDPAPKKNVNPEQCRNAIVGRTLLTLMEFDPNLASEIENQFRGKIQVMPNPIRQKTYMEHLFREELQGKLNKPLAQVNDELLKKQKDIVTKRVKDMQIERATRSPASKDIDKMVIRAYDFSPGFDAIKNDDEHMMQASRVLNVIHVINKSVQHAQVFWLCPLQIAFGKSLEEEDDNDMLKLALLLDLASEHLKLPIPELYTYADEIMGTLKKEDPDFHKKVVEAQKNKVKPNIKEFNEECINQNQLQAEKIYKEMLAAQGQERFTENVPEKLVPLFADPQIFIRKWLSQGFAGILNMNAIMMTWDYLFLNKWSKRAVMNVVLGILGLLRPWMLRATGYAGVRKVFLEEPAKLYTADLRKSYQHLEKNNSSLKGFPQNSNFVEAPALPPQPKPKTPPPVRKPLSPPPKIMPAVVPMVPFTLDINLDSDEEPEEEPLPDEPEPPREPTPPPPREPTPPPPPPPREPTPPPPPPREPTPPPPTPPPREPTPPPPPPPREPTPPPPPPPAEFKGWVPYNKSYAEKKTPKPTPVQKPFDLYIDGLRFLPDNVAVAKVTGRFFNVPDDEGPNNKIGDISVLPDTTSPCRAPKFKLRVAVNKEGAIINPYVVCMLKAYGYETHSDRIVVLGSCILGIFEENGGNPQLRCGGHQLRLRGGIPHPDGGVESLSPDDMDDLRDNPITPGLTLLVRLLPHEEAETQAPDYEKGYYQSQPSKPTKSEEYLYKYYSKSKDFKDTVGTKCRAIQKQAGSKELPDGEEMKKWIEDKLNHKKQKAQPPVDLQRFIKYDQNEGLCIVVQQAFCLATYHEHRYTQAFSQIVFEKDLEKFLTASEPETRFTTNQLEVQSPYRAPKWLDKPKKLKVKYDEKAVLIVRIMGFPVSYTPKGGPGNGIVAQREGKAIEMNLEKVLAWTILPAFSKKCVVQGSYSLPLFKAPIPPEILEDFADASPDVVELLAESALDKNSPLKVHPGASIDISIWDGRFQTNEAPQCYIEEWAQPYAKQIEDGVDLQPQSALLQAIVGKEKAEKNRSDVVMKKLPTYNDIIMENQDPKTKEFGPKGNTYEADKNKFLNDCQKFFKTAFDEALKKAGQQPF